MCVCQHKGGNLLLHHTVVINALSETSREIIVSCVLHKKILFIACVYIFAQDVLCAFFGLCYARGLLGANMYDVRLLWGGDYSTVFEATMSVNRKANAIVVGQFSVFCSQGFKKFN